MLHYERDEFGPAARHLGAVLRRAPLLPPNARLLFADCLDRLGNYRGAVREYAALAQADPTDTRVSFRLFQAKAPPPSAASRLCRWPARARGPTRFASEKSGRVSPVQRQPDYTPPRTSSPLHDDENYPPRRHRPPV